MNGNLAVELRKKKRYTLGKCVIKLNLALCNVVFDCKEVPLSGIVSCAMSSYVVHNAINFSWRFSSCYTLIKIQVI